MQTVYKILRQHEKELVSLFHTSKQITYPVVPEHWITAPEGGLFVFESLPAATWMIEDVFSLSWKTYHEPFWLFEAETYKAVHCGMALSGLTLQVNLAHHEFWTHFSWKNGSYTNDALFTYATPLGTSVARSLRLVRPIAIYSPDGHVPTQEELEEIHCALHP